jgi:CRISPR-associated endonuclease/helicase Cas3
LHRSLLEQALRREPTGGAPLVDPEKGEALLRDRVTRDWSRISAAIAEAGDGSAQDLVAALLGNGLEPGVILPEQWRKALALLELRRGRMTLEWAYARSDDEEDQGKRGVILFAKRGVRLAPDAMSASESSTESDSIGSQGRLDGGELLTHHLADVERRAFQFAERLRMPKALAEDVALAASLHDVGKADERFQRYLAGNPWLLGRALAKSGKRRTSREDSAARRAAGLPDSWRHEALSVRIAREHPEFAKAHDPELVLWLIGTHHGYGRPQFPHAEPRDDEAQHYRGFAPYEAAAMSLAPAPGPQRVDFELSVPEHGGIVQVDWQMMFARLEKRYGIWGLARLEAIVRLADHRASEAIAEPRREALV